LTENIVNNIPDSAWKGAKKLDTVWGIPSRAQLPNPPINYMFFRQDWLDKLGLEMPKTTEDVEKILKAFTEDDPDGNGIDDTYGMCYNGSNTINQLLLFFGVDSWREEFQGDKLVAQAMTDRARQAYIELRSWDKAGYLCHDGITDNKANDQMVGTNKVGMMITSGDKIKNLTDVLHDNGYTDAEFALCTNQITSSLDGQFYGWSRSDNWSTMTMVTSMAQNHETIFKLLNWMYSEEGTFFQSYGIEGREYTLQDDKPVIDEDYWNKKSYLGMYMLGRSYNTYYPEIAELAYGSDEFGKLYIEETINNADKYFTDRTDIKFQYPDLESFTLYPNWRKGIENNMLKFTSGDLDPADDSVWQSYLQECEDYGIQKLMDEAAEQYKKDQQNN
jgi:putative aldouronate transport system substrate-binding protein